MRVAACLTEVQHDLFDLGGELSIPGYDADERRAGAAARGRRSSASMPACAPLKEFILPGGTARGEPRARRAQPCAAAPSVRWCISGAPTPVRECTYASIVNRLSDLLFVLARVLNRDGGPPRRSLAQGPPARLAGWARSTCERPCQAARAQCAPDGAAGADRARRTSRHSPSSTACTSPHLYAVALRILREAAAAEEVLQGELRQRLAPRRVVRRRQEPAADVVDQHRPQSLPGPTAPARGRNRNDGR